MNKALIAVAALAISHASAAQDWSSERDLERDLMRNLEQTYNELSENAGNNWNDLSRRVESASTGLRDHYHRILDELDSEFDRFDRNFESYGSSGGAR